MDDLLSEFLTETSESLATLDVELVNLEQNPNDPTILANIFRLVHTIKGTCGFLGLPRLETVAHASENVLGKFRDRALEVSPDSVTLILESLDRIKWILGYLEENEVEPEGDDQDLIVRLNAVERGEEDPVASGAAPAAPDSPAEIAPAEDAPAEDAPDEPEWPVAAELLEEVAQAQAAGVQAASQAALAAEMEAERAQEAGDDADSPPAPEAAPSEPPAEAAPSETPAEAAPPEPPAEAAPPAKTPPQTAPAAGKAGANGDQQPRESQVAAQSIRVNVELLENLMTLVSELVLTRNQLLQMVRGRDDSEFTVPLQRLSHITSDLQEGVMKTRMQPIGNAWAKLPRIVRDLGLETHKKIDLQMYGAETELDRQVLDLIKDPLTHMVRNSADHGLEDTSGRLAAGKPETGVISLNAYHEGGHIIIEIKDDGRGLNADKIKAKALANGLASEGELESMADSQLYQMIFKPGFSTAEQVTAVSGRGVGMDVVRTNIEKIGGTIELKSEPGVGTTFIIKIPLTLAIVSALIVASGGERFAIPQISVLELVRVTQHSDTTIERINQSPVLRLRNRLLPLVSLKHMLGLSEEGVEGALTDEEVFVVVTQVGTFTFGILVDQVFDTEEIVVKPVAPILRHVSIFSGNTILGDGSVIMILDPNGIAAQIGENALGGAQQGMKGTEVTRRETEKTSVLVFRAGGTGDPKAVPLALVARLEEVDLKTIENSQGVPVVQYRGHLMPLISVDGSYQFRAEGRQPVLVFSDRDRSMGLVVDEIMDIVDEHINMELTLDQPGLLGTAVIAAKATDVIDAGYYLTQAFGDWFTAAESEGYGEEELSRRILLVDDSAFFRNLLTPLLSVSGYEVRAVDSAPKALELRDQGHEVDLIISDIEMPDMNGFEFARQVRAGGRWAEVPMVALSSHATEKDFENGRAAGYDDYVAKFDRDALLQTLQALLQQSQSVNA